MQRPVRPLNCSRRIVREEVTVRHAHTKQVTSEAQGLPRGGLGASYEGREALGYPTTRRGRCLRAASI